MELFLLLTFITAPLVFIDFAFLLFKGEGLLGYGFKTATEVYSIVFMPFLYLTIDDVGKVNDCCRDGALFSPAHRASIYILIVLCLCAYGYSSVRKKPAPPLLELVVNGLLVAAVVLNVFIAIQIGDAFFGWLGNAPIVLLFGERLIANHRFITEQLNNGPSVHASRLSAIIQWPLWKKMPLFLAMAVPVLILLDCLLLLFGQKPDSFILAFTETYHRGLSELDCSNVTCPDGHFLCTVAASGHRRFVKPIRKGVRQQVAIKVNRQLLVSNAFEELLAERLPLFHRRVRRLYNFIGGNGKRLYDALGNRWIADAVYVLLKPLEWFFLVGLYLFDRQPENRIAKQYLHSHHRRAIDAMNLNQCPSTTP